MKILHKIAKFRTQILLLIVAFSIMAISVGMYTKNYNKISCDITASQNKETKIRGTIVSYPEVNEDNVSFCVRVDETEREYLVGEKIYVTVANCKGNAHRFGYTDKVLLKTKLTANSSSKNPGAFNYDEYLFSQGICARGYVDFKNVILTKAESSFSTSIYHIRTGFISNVQKYFSPKTAGLVCAIVSGNRDKIEASDSAALKMSGIYHIVAISGLHLNLFIFMATYFVSKLKTKRLKKAILTLITTAVLGGFVLIFTGFGLSVYRALIMMLVLSVSSVISRDYSAKNSLFISGFVIVCFMPYSLWNSGFLLSFLSTLSVLVSIDLIKLMQKRPSLEGLSKNYIVTTAIVSLMSILFTLPVTVSSFGYITIYSWLTNLLVLPVVPYFLGGSIIFAILSAFESDAICRIFAYALEALSSYILYVAHFVASLPYSAPEVTPKSVIMVLTFVFSFAMAMYCAIKKTLKKAFAIILIFALASGFFLKYNDRSDVVRVTFADVNQGECAIVEIQNKTVLIDCGTNDASSEFLADAVCDILRMRGRSKIDAVIISHFHSDHANMLPFVAQAFEIDSLLIPAYYDKYEYEAKNVYRMLLETATVYNINVEYISDGSSILFSEETKIQFLSPSNHMFYDNNDMSVVTKLSHGKSEFLFCGDIENEGIEKLLEKEIECDVLKVPHHGGYCKELPSLIDKASCETAVISCGKNNVYGHPKPKTLKVLKSKDLKILRTDTDGAVTIEADKSKILKIKTMQ